MLDETLYISKRKYGFSYEETVNMIRTQVTPFVDIRPTGAEEHQTMTEILQTSTLKPSDALHVSVMQLNNIEHIVSENTDIDKVSNIERIWLNLI